jgi:hypothetical protein
MARHAGIHDIVQQRTTPAAEAPAAAGPQVGSMKLDPTKRDRIEYDHHEINWTTGVGEPAGVYWHLGRSVIVAHESAGEERLLAEGAVLIATLRFDADPLETVHRNGSIQRMAPRQVSDSFLVSGVN